ncbi:hypothetical protein VTK26DRAFT_4566 [Humicola hyalothermophila]
MSTSFRDLNCVRLCPPRVQRAESQRRPLPGLPDASHLKPIPGASASPPVVLHWPNLKPVLPSILSQQKQVVYPAPVCNVLPPLAFLAGSDLLDPTSTISGLVKDG